MEAQAENTPRDWLSVPFDQALAHIPGPRARKLLARDYLTTGRFPVIDQGKRPVAGWTDDESVVIDRGLPFVVFGDHTRTFKYVDVPFALGADGTQLLKPSADFHARFFYYACLTLDVPNRGYNRHFALLKEHSIVRPPQREQEGIAAVLRAVERAIEVEDQLVSRLGELKQASMRELFTRGLHGEARKDTDIGQIPESWGVQPLAGLREFLQYGTSAKCDYDKGKKPVLRIPNVTNGRIDWNDLKRCTLDERDVAKWSLTPGDVLFIRTNGVRERVGTCAVYRGQPSEALFASYLIRVRLRSEVLDPGFFQRYTSTAVGAAQLSGTASPAADGKFNINTTTLDSVLVPLPRLDEQIEIAAILDVIDKKLSVHERKRAVLQDLFKTLLHDLMTGRIRVAVLDIDVSEVTAA